MSLRNHTLSVERTTGDYVDGTWTADPSAGFSIEASVQPVTGREMLLLPENRRNRSALKLFTSTELKTAKPQTQNADRITYNGDVYEVVRVDPWNNGIINHFRAFVSKVEAVEMPS